MVDVQRITLACWWSHQTFWGTRMPAKQTVAEMFQSAQIGRLVKRLWPPLINILYNVQ